MAEEDFSRLNIAVLLPCYNEGKSIASVVIGFRKALPAARIYVYDNNSSDDTSSQAAFAGATVVPSRRQAMSCARCSPTSKRTCTSWPMGTAPMIRPPRRA